MKDIEKEILHKSLENANQAINLLSSFIAKNEILYSEILKNKLAIDNLRKEVEKIHSDIKTNYPDDLYLRLKVEKILSNKDVNDSYEAVKEMRNVISLTKLIAANITSFDGDPSIWYKYTESVKKLELKADEIS